MSPSVRLFSAVTGYFLQGDEDVDASKFDYKLHNFGLKPQPPVEGESARERKSSWERFEHQVRSLNENSSDGTKYKLFFIGRHGQAVNDIAEDLYGQEVFQSKWAMLEGNGKLQWKDPSLIERGIRQSKEAIFYWLHQIVKENISIPDAYYTSPQKRALETLKYTYSKLSDTDFVATVTDDLRAPHGIFTPDMRGNRTDIERAYPLYKYAQGFTETDELWTPDYRETEEDKEKRVKRFLEVVFTHDEHSSLSITSHPEVIDTILRIIGHKRFQLRPGHILPVLIKAESVPSGTTT